MTPEEIKKILRDAGISSPDADPVEQQVLMFSTFQKLHEQTSNRTLKAEIEEYFIKVVRLMNSALN